MGVKVAAFGWAQTSASARAVHTQARVSRVPIGGNTRLQPAREGFSFLMQSKSCY